MRPKLYKINFLLGYICSKFLCIDILVRSANFHLLRNIANMAKSILMENCNKINKYSNISLDNFRAYTYIEMTNEKDNLLMRASISSVTSD